MILSNTLSWWPDFVPEKDTDNEDIILLPDRLFINLIDIKLQQEITNTNNLDTNATTTIMLLLGKGPTDLKWDLSDWTTEDFEGKSILFYQGKNYIPKDYNLWKKIISQYHDFYLPDILEKLRPLMLLKSIIGGLEWEPSSRTMSKDVAYANNSRSTKTHQHHHLTQYLDQQQPDLSQIYLWIWLLTFLQ